MARLNAKTIDYKLPGSVAAAAGWTPENISGVYTRLTKDKSSKNARNIASHTAGFLARRGTTLAKARPGQLVAAVDYAAREEARKQQNKQGFFDSIIGKVLVGAAQFGAGFIPGVGPAVAAGIGAAAGAAGGGGILGAVSGGLAGYGIGSAGQWVAQGGLGRLGATLTGKVPSVSVSSGWQIPGQAAGIGGKVLGGARLANTIIATLGGAAAIKGAQSVTKGGTGGGTGGLTATPSVTPSSPEKDQEKIRNEAIRRTLRAGRDQKRVARRNSWIAEGAHTGRGDPRAVRQALPMAQAA